jgi:hypothetical protein
MGAVDNVVDNGDEKVWPDVADPSPIVHLDVHRTGTDSVQSNPVSCSAGVCS